MKIFAYGSNMNFNRLRARVPSAVKISNVYLPGYILRCNKVSSDGSSKGNVVLNNEPDSKVWGVLFEIDEKDKPALDRAEGLGMGYIEANFKFFDTQNVEHLAQIYLASESHINNDMLPYDWYKEFILSGAINNELPQEYINTIKNIPSKVDTDEGRRKTNLTIAAMDAKRELQIKFAGRLIDLLGQQMYGGAVPSVAELVANAWDADAQKIEIQIPEDVKAPGAEIIVKDHGKGMSFEELNAFYLHIGYERRLRGERTEGGRLVMGRKGIGKLAGFGIAEDIIVTSVKDGHLVEIKLNYTELRNLHTTEKHPLIPLRDEQTDESDGVKVTFKGLKLVRNINIDSFRQSMARRFAIGSEQMEILVNGTPISKENLGFEYRYPESGWITEEIEGFGPIKYWFGFLNNTIKDAELRGVSVFARERVAQFTPFFFNLSGGINGQVALEYLTGQVKADVLDNDIDHIATDRQTVNWQFGNAPLLEEWGRSKVKELCADWKKKHDQKNIDRFQHNLGEFFTRIDKLSSKQEKQDITSALTKIASIERIEEQDFRIIANAMVSGVERESVKKVIGKINTASDEALPELYEAIKEWDIISAVSTAEVVYGKIQIIEQFKKHIDERLPEKAGHGAMDMQTFIKEYPWLLGHQYEQLTPADFTHEKGVDKWIEDVLVDTNREYSAADERDGRRFDLLCIKNDWLVVIIELMRPNVPEDYDHVMRLNRYVTRVATHIKENDSNPYFKGKSVFGLLIADHPSKDSSLGTTKISLKNSLESITWNGLFEAVKANYKEYYQLLKNKAPDDPRLQGLVNL